MNAKNNRKTNANGNHFKFLMQSNKNEKITAKRKLTEIIIDELEEDSERNNIEKKEDSLLLTTETYQLTYLQSPDISDDYNDEKTRASKKKSKRLNLDKKRNLLDSISDLTISPMPVHFSPIKNRDKITQQKKIAHEIINEASLIQRPNLTNKILKHTVKSKQTNHQYYDIDTLLIDQFQENGSVTSKNSFFSINKASNRDNLILSEIEIELSEANSNKDKNIEKLSPSASYISLNHSDEINESISSKNIHFINYRAAQESLIDENINENINENIILNTSEYINENETVKIDELVSKKTSNISGIEWLKEKLLKEDGLNKTEYLNRTGLDCTSLVTNSNLFLTDNDFRKKKIKYVKNGFAERLQKILLRQSSSVNFIRHHMNKEKSKKYKGIKNTITAYPFFKQSSFHKQFSLIYTLNLSESNEQESHDKYIYILVSNEILESLKAFNDDNEAINLIKIYPPWRRMILKDSKLTIYFDTNLIEMFPLDDESEKILSDICILNKEVFALSGLKCTRCNNENFIDCELKLLDIKRYLTDLKKTISKARLISKRYPVKETKLYNTSMAVSSKQNYFFYAQTDSEYYVHQNAINSSVDSQYMKINSILDALENIGYYGFVTFRATIQRIGMAKIFYEPSNTTQPSQQNFHQLKRHVIVSDKFGMLALIIIPVEVETIEESQKYQFNSLKFLEKQLLSPKENSSIYFQIEFLWEKINQKKRSESKSVLKKSPKSIYVFEFMNETSWLELLGTSRNYISLKDFDSLSAACNEIEESSVVIFNLIDVIPIKLHKKMNDKHVLYILINTPNISNFRLKEINFDYTNNFFNAKIFEKLITNYVSLENVITLKNIEISKNPASSSLDYNGYTLNSNFFTHVEIKTDNFENILQKKNILLKIFKEVNDPDVKLFDFLKITGSVMDICEENCSFEMNCIKCKHGLNKSEKPADKLKCETCGFTNEKPEIKVEMQVILNCANTSLLVKVKLHAKTIFDMLPIDTIIRNDEAFDVSIVLNKKLGPIFAFVYNLNDNELSSEEILFS